MGRRIGILLTILLTSAIWCLPAPAKATAQPIWPTRIWQPPAALNQDGIGSCVGAAWAGVMLSEPSPFPADMWDIYYSAQKVDQWPGEGYEGTSIEAGADILIMRGLIGSVTYTEDVEEARQWVLDRGPVVWGMMWPNIYITPQGYLQISEDGAGKHAIEIYGVDGDTFLLQQSWGANWGPKHNGRIKAKFGVVQWLMEHYGGVFALPTKAFSAIGALGFLRKMPV